MLVPVNGFELLDIFATDYLRAKVLVVFFLCRDL